MRQRSILRMVVKGYIESAGPVSSGALKRQFNLGMSTATIRNEMSKLESMGFLGHPYTSAGRVPTNLGYEAFASELMEVAILPEREKLLMRRELCAAMSSAQELIRESSRLVSRLARLLGVVLSPEMNQGVLQRLEIVQVSSQTIMFVISIRGGFIRTILMQISTELKRSQLDQLVTLLNERLAGLTLDEIRRTCEPRIKDLSGDETGLVKLIVDRSSQLFSDERQSRNIQLEGTTYILSQPEFSESTPVRELIEFLDDEPSVVRMMEDTSGPDTVGRASIQIGCASGHLSASRISIVSAPFVRSNLQGMIGVIGPTRMNYARAVALVEGMATLMSITGGSENLA